MGPIGGRPGKGLIVVMVLLHGLAGWFLADQFNDLAAGGWAGVGLLALLGYQLGRADRVFSGLALAVGAFLGGVDWWKAGLFWAVPAVVGALAGLGAAIMWREKLGSADDRPSMAVYAWRATGLLAGLAPLAAAITASGGVAPLVGGAVIVATNTVHVVALSRLTRYFGLKALRVETLTMVAAILLAFGPFGEWLVRWLANVPAAPFLLPAAAVGMLHVNGRIFTRLQPGLMTLAARLITFASSLLLGKGILLFCATGVAHPDADLLSGSLVVVAVQCGSVLWAVRDAASPLWSLRRVDAATFALTTVPFDRDNLLSGWIHDALARRPESPDLTLPHTMAAEARLAVMREGQSLRGRLLPVTMFAPQVERPASEWLAQLDYLVRTMDRRLPAESDGERDLLRAHRLIAMAESDRRGRQWARAAEHYRAAVDLLARRPNLAAATSLDLADVYGTNLHEPDEAVVIASAIAEDAGLSPVIRQRAELITAITLNASGRPADAEPHLDRAQEMQVTKRDFRLLVAESRKTGMTMGARAERKFNELLMAAAADTSGATTAADFQLGNPTLMPHERGIARLRLATKYAGHIDILMGSLSPGLLGAAVKMQPDLLSDDALRAVEMMIGNARDRGDRDRADGLTVIRDFLRDARTHGIDAAVAAIPPMGPLPMQYSLTDADGRLLDPDNPEDALQIGRHLTQTDTVVVEPELITKILADVEGLPPDLRTTFDRFTGRITAFQHTGDDATLDEVIDAGLRLLDNPRLAEHAPNLSLSIPADLAGMLTNRFERSGRPDDLAEGLRRLRTAVEATTDAFPDRATMLNNLAVILRYRAGSGGDTAELDEAIALLEHAATLPRANLAQIRHNLGLALQDHYLRTGDLGALESSLRVLEQALTTIAKGNPLWPMLQQAKGISLSQRFLRTNDLPDLNASVESFRAAVDGTPLRRAPRAMFLDSLGNALRLRGEATGSADDLREAAELLQQAIDLLPEGGFRAQIVLGNIAHTLRAIYQRTGDVSWLNRSIDAFQQSCDRQPDGSLLYPDSHRDLANTVQLRHTLTGRPTDEKRAVEAYRNAVSSTAAGHTRAVLSAARFWIAWAVQRSAWREVAEAGELALDAAHRLVRSQLSRTHKEDWLRELQGLPTEIAIARMHLDDPRGAALALEEGSATLLSEALQRQLVEFDRLMARGHAPLAERYAAASADLAALTAPPAPASPVEIDFDARDQAVRAAVRALDETIDEIRAVPEYEDFLRRPTLPSILAAAIHPLVYLAAGQTEGLALVVHAGVVTPVPLPELRADTVRAYGERLRAAQHGEELPAVVEQIARRLWTSAVADVMPHLGERVTVIPIGNLAALPIHAAHDGDTSLLDAAVVTYSPNALAVGKSSRRAERAEPDRLLAVAEPEPVDAPALVGAGAEAAVAAATFTSVVLAGRDASRTAVLNALGTAGVIHFACHAHTVPEKPWQGGVVLAGNEEVTVADLAERGLDARLVILSACQTAVPGNLLPEELIGLPTATLQAGAAGVIGSLWPVLDQRSLLLMVSFYEHWRHGGLEPAAALRAAQTWMRRTTDGEKYEKFDGLLNGTEWLPAKTARACWDALALTEPDGQIYADPVGWAAFCYVGS